VGRTPRLQAVGIVGVVGAVAVTYGRLLQPFDLLTFLHAGRMVVEGRTPYVSTTSPLFQSGHAFVYPLFVAWLFAPLALLPADGAELLYAAGSVVAIIVSTRLLGHRPWTAAALLMAASTTITGLQMGTLNAFLLLGLAGAWYWRDSRPVLAGVLLGLTAAAKIFLLPVVIWPVLRRRYSSAVAALGTGLVLAGFGAGLGSLPPMGYLHMMSKLDAEEQVTSWSLSSLFSDLGAGHGVATVAPLLTAGLFALIVWHRRRSLSDGQLLAAAVVCGLVISPILWSSYLLLLAVPILLVTTDEAWLAGFAVASWVIVTPDEASAVRVGIGVVLTVIVAIAASRLRPARPRYPLRKFLLPLGVAAGLGGVIIVLPSQARGPVPAMGAVSLAAAWCLRGRRSSAQLIRC
jgi:hypothetical protein